MSSLDVCSVGDQIESDGDGQEEEEKPEGEVLCDEEEEIQLSTTAEHESRH